MVFEKIVDKAVELAVEDGVGVGFFVAGAGVLDEFVGLEDVVADLLAPAGRFAGAELANRGGVLFELHLGELAAEDFHGFFLVLELGAFVLNRDDGAGGEVGDADGGVGGVDGLAAVAAGVVDVDAKVFFVNSDVGAGLEDGKNFDEREGGLAEVVGVEGGKADEAVDAVLGFQSAESVLAGDFVDGGFDAGFLAGGFLEQSGFEVMTLAKTEVHALEHASPVHGFGAAGAGGEAKNGVFGVVNALEAKGFFQGGEGLLHGGELLGQLVGQVAIGKRDQLPQIGNLGFEQDPRLGFVSEVGKLLIFGRSIGDVVPDFGVSDLPLELGKLSEFLINRELLVRLRKLAF